MTYEQLFAAATVLYPNESVCIHREAWHHVHNHGSHSSEEWKIYTRLTGHCDGPTPEQALERFKRELERRLPNVANVCNAPADDGASCTSNPAA